MSEANKAIVRRSFEEVWNKRNLNIIDEIYAADYIGHVVASPEIIRGAQGLKRFAAIFQFTFPDIYFTIEDQIAEGSKVASRWIVHGTQRDELISIGFKGELVTLTGISIQRITSGKIVESWDHWDALRLLQGMTRDVFEQLSVGI